MFLIMPQQRASETRRQLIDSATDVIRRGGLHAATVEVVCARTKVSKGAFFHHFRTKEELAEACLKNWDASAVAMEAMAPFQQFIDPRERLLGYLDFYIALFKNPAVHKSCLAGVTVQEVGGQNPTLRAASNECFFHAERRLQTILDEAFQGAKAKPNTASLAALWMAAIQGALILCKASGDEAVLGATLNHVKAYIEGLLPHMKAKAVRGKL
jgi:TetR/AcrR family transcriptional regulator, transcriptional repressor for nem operon